MLSILHLESDIWDSIAPYINYNEVLNLILTGNRKMAQLIGSTTRSFSFRQRLHAVDLDCVLSTARATPNLQELIFAPFDSVYWLMIPVKPLVFPPKLTSLTAIIHHALDFFLLTHDLSELAPSLTYLQLSGKLDSRTRKLNKLTIPRNLQTLIIRDSPILMEDEEDIAKLPRTLTHLQLIAPRFPTITRNVWPTELSVLHLRNIEMDVTIEHLPRSLTDLILYPLDGKLNTSFKCEGAGSNFAFPWRQFFPLMSALEVYHELKGSLTFLLGSMISHVVYTPSEVSDFISSGFWSLQQLDWTPLMPYPSFKRLILADMSDFETAARELAPWLRVLEATLTISSEFPFGTLRYLPSADSYDNNDDIDFAGITAETIPSSLKYFSSPYIPVFLLERLPALGSLFTTSIADLQGAEISLEDVKWPSTLHTLSTHQVLQGPALRCLPNSLTSLQIPVPTRADWSIVASQLVNLIDLHTDLNCEQWNSDISLDEPLTPIVSTSLEQFGFRYTSVPSTVQPQPFAYEFFGKQSPLPTSLTQLSINSYTHDRPIPLTVLPYLPRQLRDLSISGAIDWNSSIYFTEPHIASMTPFELIASLPPDLSSLGLMNYGLISLKGYYILSAMPKNLCHLSHDGLFQDVAPGSDVSDFLKHLPRRLVEMSRPATKNMKIMEQYFKQIRPYLVDN